jgi:hypothetical protein
MPFNAQKPRPGELCQLLNSTPLGEVINLAQLRQQRSRAGMRIGDGQSIDLIRYVGWLVYERHAPKAAPSHPDGADLFEVAVGAAELAAQRINGNGRQPQLSSRQQLSVAALLIEPNQTAAAARAGMSRATLCRWLHQPNFQVALDLASREMCKGSLVRLRAASDQAVAELVRIIQKGRREGDRFRAAVAIFDRSQRGLNDTDSWRGDGDRASAAPFRTYEIVQLLANQLREIFTSELPTAEKARLTATLSDATLRAISADQTEQRLEALENILRTRKPKQQT